MAPNWTRLIRFIAREDGQVHLGEVKPTEQSDVGLAALDGPKVFAKVITGSVFDGVVTSRTLTVDHTLLQSFSAQYPPPKSPSFAAWASITATWDHALEANLPIPDVPVLFIKPRTALSGPYPAAIPIPRLAQDGTSDYEAELCFVMGKSGRDIPEEHAMEYVLGFTAGNDVSARTQQFQNSQWCFSKGFDGSCPLGPVLVAPSALGDVHNLRIRAMHNGKVVQDSNTCEMIFTIPKIISFLSQGTTLERGTVVMTGTGPGVGSMRTPKVTLKHDDVICVEIENIGTLVNSVYYE
ncbi:hypothetical protein E4U31_002955 [Claviceps sp. LM219 group G6]|nr:hypothetical protein E4U31_002955 [Claviceps sp. LM219 group G6]